MFQPCDFTGRVRPCPSSLRSRSVLEREGRIRVSHVLGHATSREVRGRLARIPSIRYLITSQETGNGVVTPLGLRVFMGGGDHLFFDEEIYVSIGQGVVKGYRHTSRNLYEFHGIPYATAPNGVDKFKAPLPAPVWEGTFDAVDKNIICPQRNDIEYREDCLVANIFVPEISDILKPVLVYIHGGAFVTGYGNRALPYNLVERDIVAVTFNYRVGVHGFLCLNTEDIPGNAGLKDQIAALTWIKENIQAFGGNPDDVTVAGYSVGAASAELMMLLPAAQGLFNKVILESGSGVASWAVNPGALELAQNLALKNGASYTENITMLNDYYLSLSYEQIIDLVPSESTELKMCPCIENGTAQPIITELPYNILIRGEYNNVPLLTGYTDGEGLLFYLSRESIYAEMNDNFNSRLPPNFFYHSDVDEDYATELIKSFYFEGKIINEESVKNYTNYFTDSHFSYWITKSAKKHAQNALPVYLYEYSYVTSATQTNGPNLGATHCAQTNIILDRQGTIYSDNDLIVQHRLIDMWANFIKFGEPTSSSQIYWNPLDPDRMNYLAINFDVQEKTFPLKERLEFWDQIWLKDY
ncbi:Esterase FE4 [Eumeta japonica]|uniref:Esterase FE4 n=1 Tax=Eumeta variegata TaxID=151549 RepID=A0A4C1Y7P8_EUMVA|nr:Esterase FE4 [Eumeta japonica]